LAYHRDGVFDDIEVRKVASDVAKWERDFVYELSQLAALIHRLVDLVSDRPGLKLELCCEGLDVLEVREQLSDAGKPLSPEVMAMWEQGLASRENADAPERGDSRRAEGEYTAPADGWESESVGDFTACTADTCGYCGRCDY